MRVYIGVPTADAARHAVFYDHLAGLVKPEGTIGANFHTNSAAYNRNLIIDDALAAGATHVLFIDDDMAIPPDSLMKLLAHNKMIVGGIYLNKAFPHPPVLFKSNRGKPERIFLNPGMKGLIEVDAVGFGFMLVNTSVFSMMEPPYVRNGEVFPDQRNEDISFCFRARSAGCKVFCDLDTPIGHMGVTTFWPDHSSEHWQTSIDTGGDTVFGVPQQQCDRRSIRTPLGFLKDLVGK